LSFAAGFGAALLSAFGAGFFAGGLAALGAGAGFCSI
jgi:hypothetical protein